MSYYNIIPIFRLSTIKMNRNLIHGLYRTNDPKFPTYKSDGYGRDHYIVSNNGGFIPTPHICGLQPPQGFFVSPRARPMKTTYGSKIRHSGNIYYPPDGSGRDTYIVTNNGGTCNDPNVGFIDFQKNTFLRDSLHSPFYTPKMNKKI